jgi:serine/threonine protein phosphatase PrpC
MTTAEVAIPKSAMTARPADEELDLFGITDRGRVRPDNQDHFLVCTVHPQVIVHNTSLTSVDALPLRGTRLATLMLVADGVGGAADGSEAARLATESVTRYVASTLRSYPAAGNHGENEFHAALKAAAMQAHDAVRAEAAARPDQRRMATTLTVAIFVWPYMYAVQVGDSRCYTYMGGALRQITRDQTVAQQLVDEGAMREEQLRRSPLKNVLSSAIGSDEATPIVSRISLDRGAVTLLCSDGLTKHVTDAEIESHIASMQTSEQLARDLLKLALDRGGSDNTTIVVGRAPLKRKQ